MTTERKQYAAEVARLISERGIPCKTYRGTWVKIDLGGGLSVRVGVSPSRPALECAESLIRSYGHHAGGGA